MAYDQAKSDLSMHFFSKLNYGSSSNMRNPRSSFVSSLGPIAMSVEGLLSETILLFLFLKKVILKVYHKTGVGCAKCKVKRKRSTVLA